MQNEGEITIWLAELQRGNQQAAAAIWEQVFDHLVKVTRRRLEQAGLERRTRDEEDLALSAIKSVFQGAAENRYPQFADSQDFWKLLITIVKRKISQKRKHDFAAKRGAGQIMSQDVLGDPEQGAGIGELVGNEPTPEFVLMMQETLHSLKDETLIQIAVLKMEGHNNQEIAEKLNCSTRKIERKLNLIRLQLSSQNEPD